MRRMGVAAALVVAVRLVAACEGSAATDAPPPGPASDAGADGARPRRTADGDAAVEACGAGPFEDLTRLDALSSDRNEGRVSLTDDELTVVYERVVPETILLIASRGSIAEPFGEPVEIGSVKTVPNNTGVGAPVISPDGLTLVVTATIGAAQQLWLLERGSRTEPFGAPKRALSELNEGTFNAAGSFSRDGRRLYFSSSRAFTKQGPFENNNVFVAESTTGTYATPAPLIDDATGTALVGINPAVTADGRTLYFSRLTTTGFRIYVAELVDGRAKKIELVDALSVADDGPNQIMGAVSADHCRLYFAAAANSSTFDLFVARRR